LIVHRTLQSRSTVTPPLDRQLGGSSVYGTDHRRRQAASVAGAIAIAAMFAAGCGNSVTETTVGTTTQSPIESTSQTTPGNERETVPLDLALPLRTGEPPLVTEGIPHIQLDQTATDQMFAKLSAWAFALDGVAEQPSRASLPGAKALTVAPELPVHLDRMIVGREFAHIHPQTSGSGSLHLRLATDQASQVVESGWGEWHPFALEGTMPGMVMVYAPRSDGDLEVIKDIIQASLAHVTG
jgi:hypothetical protein